MFLRKIEITNVCAIEHLVWEIDERNACGWHVILGDEGTGKSSLLRAVALVLGGAEDAGALGEDWNDWLRWEESGGEVELTLGWDPAFDRFSGRGDVPMNASLRACLSFVRLGFERRVTLFEQIEPIDTHRHVWGGAGGWFWASYDRSILSAGEDHPFSGLTSDLMRRLAHTYGKDALVDPTDPTRIIVPGVVLLDDIDADLDPTWQRHGRRWLCERFPRIQFVVATR